MAFACNEAKQKCANIFQSMPLVTWRTNWHWFFEDLWFTLHKIYSRLVSFHFPMQKKCTSILNWQKQAITIFIITGIVRPTLDLFSVCFVCFNSLSASFFNLLFWLFIYSFCGMRTLILWKYFKHFLLKHSFSLHVIGLLETISD